METVQDKGLKREAGMSLFRLVMRITQKVEMMMKIEYDLPL